MKTKKLKIGIIGIKGLPATRGADSVVESFIPYLKKKGHEIWVYGDEWAETLKEQVFTPVKIKSILVKNIRPTILFLFSAIHAVLKGNFDVIHIHNAEAAFIIPILKTRFPIVITSHAIAYRREKWSKFGKYLIKLMDRPFCNWSDVSTAVSKPLSEYYNSKYKANIRFIPNGIKPLESIDTKKATSLLNSLELKPKEYIIFVAGRILPSKGCHLLLEAMKISKNSTKVLVVGDLNQIPNYTHKLKKTIPEQTVFQPLIKDKETLLGLLSLSKLFVFPSTYEAMSMVLLDALALGVPIICSDIPANTHIVTEKKIIFKNEDIKSLGEKIEWALKNTGKVKKIVKKIQKEVITSYNWENISSKYLECYYEAIKKRNKL